jgi:hypothetical protein
MLKMIPRAGWTRSSAPSGYGTGHCPQPPALDGHASIAAANRHHARDPKRTLQLLQAT